MTDPAPLVRAGLEAAYGAAYEESPGGVAADAIRAIASDPAAVAAIVVSVGAK